MDVKTHYSCTQITSSIKLVSQFVSKFRMTPTTDFNFTIACGFSHSYYLPPHFEESTFTKLTIVASLTKMYSRVCTHKYVPG